MIPIPKGIEYWIFSGDYPSYRQQDISIKEGTPEWAREEFEKYRSILVENLQITKDGDLVEVYH